MQACQQCQTSRHPCMHATIGGRFPNLSTLLHETREQHSERMHNSVKAVSSKTRVTSTSPSRSPTPTPPVTRSSRQVLLKPALVVKSPAVAKAPSVIISPNKSNATSEPPPKRRKTSVPASAPAAATKTSPTPVKRNYFSALYSGPEVSEIQCRQLSKLQLDLYKSIELHLQNIRIAAKTQELRDQQNDALLKERLRIIHATEVFADLAPQPYSYPVKDRLADALYDELEQLARAGSDDQFIESLLDAAMGGPFPPGTYFPSEWRYKTSDERQYITGEVGDRAALVDKHFWANFKSLIDAERALAVEAAAKKKEPVETSIAPDVVRFFSASPFLSFLTVILDYTRRESYR